MIDSIMVTFTILLIIMLVSVLVTSSAEAARVFFTQTVAMCALFMAVDRILNDGKQ